MHRPLIKESQLADLLDCLYENFLSRHGANTSKLVEHRFYLTDRMSCSKSARLNFMYPVTTQDGQRVQMHNSVYSEAVSTLIQRGLAQWHPKDALVFSLTLSGYETAHARRAQVALTRWQSIVRKLNEHNGLIAVVAIIVGALVTWYFSSPPSQK